MSKKTQGNGQRAKHKQQKRMKNKLVNAGPCSTTGQHIPTDHAIVFLHDHDKDHQRTDRPKQQILKTGPQVAMTKQNPHQPQHFISGSNSCTPDKGHGQKTQFTGDHLTHSLAK